MCIAKMHIAKGRAAGWLAQKPLAVLAARFGPHGHGSGFGGFSTRLSRLGFLLMKKWWGRFTPPPVEFFFLKMHILINHFNNNICMRIGIIG